MSKKAKTTYTCSLCQSENFFEVRKPVAFTPTITRVECEVCASKFLLKVATIKGRPGFLACDSVKEEPTEFGLELLRKRNAEGNNAGGLKPKEEVSNANG